MPVSLINMPDVVMNRLFEELDFRAIMTLRKVNHALRDFIDVNKPDGKFSWFSLSFQKRIVRVGYSNAFNDYKSFEYFGNNDECYVKYGNKKTPITGKFYKQILEDLKFILQFQKSCLESFEVEGKCIAEETIYSKFLDDLPHILEPLNLKVTGLIFYSTNLLPILKSLDAKSLKSVLIAKKTHQIDIGDIKNLEVWKNLESVTIKGCTIANGEIQDFLKCKDVEVTFDTITENLLKNILEAFQTSPIMRKFDLYYINLDGNLECFGEPFLPEGQDNNPRWYFQMPESATVVWISYKTDRKYFWFWRMDRGRVPTEAMIQSLLH